MACPDDDSYALMLQGMLSSDEAAELEEHLDRCAACTDLVAQLGKVYGPTHPPIASSAPNGSRGSVARTRALPPEIAVQGRSENRSGPWDPLDVSLAGALSRNAGATTRLLHLQVGMAVAHLVWSAFLLPVLIRVVTTGPSVGAEPAAGLVAVAVAWYVIVWVPVGALLAMVSVVGLMRQRRWATVVAGVGASLSLPSLLLAPLGVLVLAELRVWRRGR